MGEKPDSAVTTAKLRPRELVMRGRTMFARASLPMRFGAVVLLLVFIGLAVIVKAEPLPQRNTDLYPLHWQNASSLPPHVASFVFARTALNEGYACATGATRPSPAPTATASPTASATPTPRATPSATRKPTPTPAILSTSAVFRTLDGGTTWTGLPTPFMEGLTCRVFVAPLDASQVFVAQPEDPADTSGLLPTVWHSDDGGATWQVLGSIAQPGEHVGVTALVAVGSQLVAEVAGAGELAPSPRLYRSEDDGMTWKPLQNTVALTDLFAAGGTLYAHAAEAASSSVTPASPLYRSADFGDTWTPITPPFANVSGLMLLRAADGASTYGVGLIPASTAYGAQAHAVIVSKDGGATWSRIDAPPTLGTLSAQMLPDGTLLVESQLDDTQPAGGFTAEIFLLRPAHTTWQLIGLGPYVTDWQVARASGQAGAAFRLWAAASSPSAPTRYVWANVP